MLKSSAVVFFIVGCFIPISVLGISEQSKKMIHDHFEQMGLECLKDNPIKEEDINNLRSRKPAAGEGIPCFLACLLKKVGVIGNDGMLEKETALEIARKVFDDEEEVKNIENFLHSCKKINDEPVGDGAKGCERAVKAYKCMIENAAEFGLDV